MKSIFLAALLISTSSMAADLSTVMKISAAGMHIQSERLKIISQNIANADSTGSSPGAKPYTRKIIFFDNRADLDTGIEMPRVSKISTSDAPYTMTYKPDHPAANEQGYVLYPNVSSLIESMDAKEAQRSYQANLRSIEITKAMLNSTLELMR